MALNSFSRYALRFFKAPQHIDFFRRAVSVVVFEHNFNEQVTQHELPDTASLNENYYEFPDDKFQLNQNYGFRKDGIVFYYNNYEIAPYAAGPTEVVIPYESVRTWIK